MQTSACPLLPPEPWMPGQGLALGTLAFSPGHTRWSCSARVCPLPTCLAQMLSSFHTRLLALATSHIQRRNPASRTSSPRP